MNTRPTSLAPALSSPSLSPPRAVVLGFALASCLSMACAAPSAETRDDLESLADDTAVETAAQVVAPVRSAPWRAKFVGNITTQGAVRPNFATVWDQITPENEGKWGSVERVRGRMEWAALDAIYAYAKANGILFKAHTMVWGSQQPTWLAGLSRAEQAAEVEEWIRLFCERYPDTALIDVVNEPPPHTTPVYLAALGGAGVSGYDWIVNAFKLTKKYCPKATLILNDYNNIEWDADHNRFIQIARAVKAAGAPIDAVGAQAHDAHKHSADAVSAKISNLARQTGLPVYITEYDIPIANDTQQKNVMQSQFTMFWNHPDVRGITLWGYVAGATWVANSGLMTVRGTTITPRPALTWLLEFLESQPLRPGQPPAQLNAGPAPIAPPEAPTVGAVERETVPSRTCDLPRTFKWQSTGPLIAPISPPGHSFLSIKDPTVVKVDDLYHVYATVFDQATRGYNMVYLNFKNWADAGKAQQFYMGDSPTRGGVAPQLFYFAPKKQWVLVYQWGASYSTSSEPGRPQSWSTRKPLLVNGPANAIDFWVVCDSTYCHLFFSADNGKLYESKMPIGQFPGTFNGYRVVMSDTQANLFEASNVFKIKDKQQYLLLVEAMGPRYFRSWTAPSLDGPWAPLAATQQNPFAGKANVTFPGGAWTDDISHGDMVRTNPDQTMTIDPCDLEFVYQGFDPRNRTADYNSLPYRLGLLTPAR